MHRMADPRPVAREVELLALEHQLPVADAIGEGDQADRGPHCRPCPTQYRPLPWAAERRRHRRKTPQPLRPRPERAPRSYALSPTPKEFIGLALPQRRASCRAVSRGGPYDRRSHVQVGVEPAQSSGRRGGPRPARPGGRVRTGCGPLEPGTEEQGRQAQLRGLDLRRHLRPHLQAVRGRLGREGRIRRSPRSTTIRPSSRRCMPRARRSTCRNPRPSPFPTS